MRKFACIEGGEMFTIDAKNWKEAQVKCREWDAIVVDEITHPEEKPHLPFDPQDLVDEIVPVIKGQIIETIYSKVEEQNIALDIYDLVAHYIYGLVINELKTTKS